MMIKISLVVLGVIAAFLLYVEMKPSREEISRSIVIAAPASKVFPFVNTRSIANSWNPWLKKDPKANIMVSGPEVGVGSKTRWEGGRELGTGSATVVESVPNERLVVKLEYQKPFVMTQEATYLLQESSGQTTITWKVNGHSNFICKVMGAFMNMDKMVGDTFLEGLAELKGRVEAPAPSHK